MTTAADEPPAREDQLDQWLAAAAADRDEGAFAELVRRHTPALYAGALRLTGSTEDAQDVVQEAWLSAWLHLPGFRGHSRVRTWLTRVATTKALDLLRRYRRTLPLEALTDPAGPAGHAVEEEAERNERAAAVRTAIAGLPERQREAVILRDLQGLSYEQVASALGVSVPAVKSALFRGRQTLAGSLEQYRADVAPIGPTAPAEARRAAR